VEFELVASFATAKEIHLMAELAVQKYVRSARVVVIASTGDWAPAGAKAGYDWLRCNASGAGCRPISGSCDRRYTVRGPDVGYTLRVRLTVTEPGQLPASDVSGPTAVIVEDVYAESTVDSGGTCVNVTSTRPGQGTFTSSSPTGPGTTPAPDTDLSFIDPFPVVRISGRFTRRRTKLTRVTINAPRGARIRLSCGGRGCPYRRKAIAVKVVRVRALQRSCRPRATIEIRVTQPKRIGKYTLVKTRRGKAPLRVDRRLMSGSTRPVRCPAG
jgi:hypothetical protein